GGRDREPEGLAHRQGEAGAPDRRGGRARHVRARRGARARHLLRHQSAGRPVARSGRARADAGRAPPPGADAEVRPGAGPRTLAGARGREGQRRWWRMTRRALALSDAGLKLIERAAARLPPERRSAFLSALATRLGEGTPALHAVEIAIDGALGAALPVF